MNSEMIPLQTEGLERVLVPREDIEKRLVELGNEIDAYYAESGKPLLLVGLLKGSFVFLADICRQITKPHSIDFMSIHSYGSGTVSGALKVTLDLTEDVTGKDILIVEDIVDSGKTLSVVQQMLADRGANSVRICTLLNKPSRRNCAVTVDHCGFEIPDLWVVGYGLDYAEKYRSLPYVAVMKNPNEE